jgi:hypothetical protein
MSRHQVISSPNRHQIVHQNDTTQQTAFTKLIHPGHNEVQYDPMKYKVTQ